VPNDVGHAKGALLGKDVMEAIWEDMSFTQLPSWVSSVPCNWGTTKRGKLSADNWRVIITIHLTITLIWLWGHDNGHKKELLNNFIDLVCAVCIANMRVSSKDQVKAYNHHITRYLSGLRRLYLDQKVKPVHHAALHLGDLLELFGPIHS